MMTKAKEHYTMKRILVFSDSHGSIDLCVDAIARIPADIILHCGDYVRDVDKLIRKFPDKDIRYVQGNNDLFTKAPKQLIIEEDGVRILAVHGHEQHVKYEMNYTTLAKFAREQGCDMAVFGHTHIAYKGETDGVKLLNPGSTLFGGTYAIIEIADGNASSCIMQSM